MSASTYFADATAYQAGEGCLLTRGRLAKPADKLIVICHGRTTLPAKQHCLQWAQNALGGPPHVQFLAEHGFAVLSIDAGGGLTWGNAASQTALGNAIAWARAQGFCSPTAKVLLLGYSMGGAVALNYAKDHPTVVAGVIGEAPTVDLDGMYPGFAAEMDAAYGGSYAANGASRSPMRFAAALAVPIRLYSGVDDATVPNAMVHAFHDALTVEKQVIDLPGGHTGFWGYIDQRDLLGWVGSLDFSP